MIAMTGLDHLLAWVAEHGCLLLLGLIIALLLWIAAAVREIARLRDELRGAIGRERAYADEVERVCLYLRLLPQDQAQSPYRHYFRLPLGTHPLSNSLGTAVKARVEEWESERTTLTRQIAEQQAALLDIQKFAESRVSRLADEVRS